MIQWGIEFWFGSNFSLGLWRHLHSFIAFGFVNEKYDNSVDSLCMTCFSLWKLLKCSLYLWYKCSFIICFGVSFLFLIHCAYLVGLFILWCSCLSLQRNVIIEVHGWLSIALSFSSWGHELSSLLGSEFAWARVCLKK